MPSRFGQIVFATKASGLRLRRLWRDRASGVRKYDTGYLDEFPHVLAEIRSPLFSGSTGAERTLELGKVQNLRIASRMLDGIVIPAGETFSFWRQIGRCAARRGFTHGRQLQEGCLIPAIGGGLCQLSNALYQAALSARCEIVERHAHSQVIPGSAAERGLDATVAWNYVDLRFRPKERAMLTVRLTPTELVVRLRAATAESKGRKLLPLVDQRRGIDAERHSCVSCGQTDCFREAGTTKVAQERTAFLLDEWWPEFTPFLDEFEGSYLFAPLDGDRFKRPGYKFPTNRFAKVRYATLQTLYRSFRRRGTPRQGARLQQSVIEDSAALAATYAKWLDPEITHLVTTISLLPFLRAFGLLGGRTYDVLMTRDSMYHVQASLDKAAEEFPDRTLLSDFRADPLLVREELSLLTEAHAIVTPHAAIAAHYENARLIPWPMPPAKAYRPGPAIVFPGPTIARKGAHEVREAARRLDLEVVLLGSELEGGDFWQGIRTRRASRDENWLDGVCAVVQPAWVEHRPRALLTALASGCPVIATEACGLGNLPGWTSVSPGDIDAICDALSNKISF